MTVDQHEDDANPYKSPQASELTSAAEFGQGKHLSDKRRIMLWMLALFSVSPGLNYAAGGDPGLERVHSIVLSLVFGAQCVRWCYYDRLEVNARVWKYLAVTMILCPGPGLVFPVYLLYTRGLQRGMVAILGAIGCLLVLLVAYISIIFLALTLFLGSN